MPDKLIGCDRLRYYTKGRTERFDCPFEHWFVVGKAGEQKPTERIDPLAKQFLPKQGAQTFEAPGVALFEAENKADWQTGNAACDASLLCRVVDACHEAFAETPHRIRNILLVIDFEGFKSGGERIHLTLERRMV